MSIYNPPPAGAGSGDMTKATYDANNDGKVASADSADAVAWANVSGKPATFTPSSHAHSQSDVTNLVSDLAAKASSTHTHAQSDVTNLVSDLAGKAASSHTHAQSDITNLVSDLAAKRAGYTLVASLASPQATGANVTPVTLTGLVFTFGANSKYRIWAMGTITPAAATTGCGFQFDVSAAVTSISVQFYHQLASTGTLTGGHSIADDASVGVSSGTPSTSSYPVTVEGIIVTGANTGTAQLRFRSETTAVITCNAGFTLIVEKIA